MRKVEGDKMDSPEKMGESTVWYPNFHIATKHLPESKEWKVGNTYDIVIRVRQTGISSHMGRDKKEHGGADFDIIGIDPKGEVKGKKTRYT